MTGEIDHQQQSNTTINLLKWSAKDWNLPFVVLVVGVYLYIDQCCEQKGKLIMIMQRRRFGFLGEKEKRLVCKKGVKSLY